MHISIHDRVINTDFGMGGGKRPPPIGGDTLGGQGSDGGGLARDLRQNQYGTVAWVQTFKGRFWERDK